MEKDTSDFILPPAPRGLCFDRNDFVKTNFLVDNFLADHNEVASLETMRDDLGVYLKVLRLAMIELINKDYANFVNLCATLIGFDKAILKIQAPLSQLNEEVLSVKQSLENAMKELSMWLNQRHTLMKNKQLLRYYSHTKKCLNILDTILTDISKKRIQEQIVIVDRAAMQYNQLKFSVSKCESIIKPEQNKKYNEVGGKLVNILNELMFKFWNDNNEDNLLKTLIILTSLDRVSETEMLIRKQAIAPLLQDIINEPALQKSKDGLEGIYKKIMSVLDHELKLLVIVTQHSKLTNLSKKYRFLVNCFWCEVENRLEVNMASIFAPGNPQLFYKRYKESMHFVKKIEELCDKNESVYLLRQTVEYKNFLRRWNLPVYFQIRFQEIAGGFESCLKGAPTTQNNSDFILAETLKCWNSLQDCWSDGIFLEALAHKFWKLSLQLLSRYATWVTSICSQRNSQVRLESTSVNKNLLETCINLYMDIEKLIKSLPKFLDHVQNKMSNDRKKIIIRESIKPTENMLQSTKIKINQCIVDELYDHFNMQLKQVSDIPRLYRKTNRSIPTKPCTYIDVIAKALDEFDRDTSKKLDRPFLTGVYQSLFAEMTNSYYKYVEDVLTSVQKTEESLRRLKQIRERSSQQSQDVTGVTDGDKIRLQLHVDVVSYANKAQSLHINKENVGKLTDLLTLVTDAVKTVDIK
ncbi:conserved oligomeric Golgi complex subunit 2 [Aricia agestis]|uniref:conserved oligomeric Golgi complex subunit 2 n=1 Tax=Aricia agestis TaxID=91739 RepID=UPI001C20474F|nr:conserved oligomeric Golgi complex subunit 2 [Aricia agestis]